MFTEGGKIASSRQGGLKTQMYLLHSLKRRRITIPYCHVVLHQQYSPVCYVFAVRKTAQLGVDWRSSSEKSSRDNKMMRAVAGMLYE